MSLVLDLRLILWAYGKYIQLIALERLNIFKLHGLFKLLTI